MAYEAADGFKSTNRAPMMAHKRSLERKSMAGGVGLTQRADPLQQPAGGEQDGQGNDPQQVAAEHGPAQEVHVTHTEGQHHVHSIHPDGHEHHSDHASAGEAHDHAKQLAEGSEQPETDGDGDEPEFE